MPVTRSPITVDDRQQSPPSPVRVDQLKTIGVPAEVRRLDLGDYQWVVDGDEGTHAYIMEEKLIGDLINSVADGRLGAFTRGDVGVGVHRILFLVGGYADLKHKGHWSTESVDNLLASVQGQGVVVIRCDSVAKSADRIASFWRYTGSPEHRTLDRPVLPDTSTHYFDPRLREAVRLLMCIPSVGERRAQALVKTYGSVRAALDALATAKSSEAEGIGTKVITDAREFLERTF